MRMLDNPWLQSIVGGLISIVLYESLKKVFLNGYHNLAQITGTLIATAVFAFGNLLEPISQAFLYEDPIRWTILLKLRYETPGVLTLLLFFGGLLPGILTGSMVIKGTSLAHHIKLGAVWAPISLSLFDAITFCVARYIVHGNFYLITWGDFTYSVVSNFVGGIPGGIIIGLLVHLSVKENLKPK